jgi:hypothetical protein
MNKEVVLFVIVVAAIIFYVGYAQGPEEPTSFVDNKTVSNYSTLLFDYEIVRYPSNAEIKQIDSEGIVLGFVTDPWNINFGVNPGNGSYSTRTIKVANKEDKDIKMMLRPYGNISDKIVFDKNDFVLKPNESASINIIFQSRNYEPGNYSGEIDLIAKKAIYNFLPIN